MHLSINECSPHHTVVGALSGPSSLLVPNAIFQLAPHIFYNFEKILLWVTPTFTTEPDPCSLCYTRFVKTTCAICWSGQPVLHLPQELVSLQMRQLFSASYVQENQARERSSNPSTTARWNDPKLYGFRFAAAFWNFHLYPQMKSSMRKEKYFRCFTQAIGAVYMTRGRAFPLPLEKW